MEHIKKYNELYFIEDWEEEEDSSFELNINDRIYVSEGTLSWWDGTWFKGFEGNLRVTDKRTLKELKLLGYVDNTANGNDDDILYKFSGKWPWYRINDQNNIKFLKKNG